MASKSKGDTETKDTKDKDSSKEKKGNCE